MCSGGFFTPRNHALSTVLQPAAEPSYTIHATANATISIQRCSVSPPLPKIPQNRLLPHHAAAPNTYGVGSTTPVRLTSPFVHLPLLQTLVVGSQPIISSPLTVTHAIPHMVCQPSPRHPAKSNTRQQLRKDKFGENHAASTVRRNAMKTYNTLAVSS